VPPEPRRPPSLACTPRSAPGRSRPVLALVRLVLRLPVPVAGDPASATRPAAPVTVDQMRLLDATEGSFLDKYTIEARLDGGATVYFSILHRSFGVGRTEFLVRSVYKDEAGRQHAAEARLRPGEWRMAVGEQLELWLGDHALVGTPAQWTIAVRQAAHSFSLTFRPLDPPWRPAAGRYRFGPRQQTFLETTVLAPRAAVTGTVRVGDRSRPVQGTGYALHTVANLAPHELADRWLLFRTEVGPLSIYLREIDLTERWGGRPLRWLLVAREGRILIQGSDVDLTWEEVRRDEQHAERYPLPGVVRLRARAAGQELTGTFRVTAPRTRDDLLAGLSLVERTLAALFAKPVSYTFQASYELWIGDGVTSPEPYRGQGVLELDHLNP